MTTDGTENLGCSLQIDAALASGDYYKGLKDY